MRTPLGEITELPRPIVGFQGAASRQGRGKREEKEEKEENGRG